MVEGGQPFVHPQEGDIDCSGSMHRTPPHFKTLTNVTTNELENLHLDVVRAIAVHACTV